MAGHSHFQAATTSAATTAAAAATMIINGTTQSPAMNALPVSVTINSVSPDAVTQPSDAHEVGSPQSSTRKSLETLVKDNKFKSTTNQFHSRHGSEHITTSHDQPTQQTFSLVNDRKQQLEQITIGKCTTTTTTATAAKSPTTTTITSHLNQSLESAKQSPVVKKFLQASDKRSSVPNWFPSKRNSLILLADQQLEKSEKKRCSEPPGDKMVAMQELATAATFDDNSEELQYGPGIVSKLRCRYLSLALRQTVKQRPTLDNLRRANSMSNLLEEENVDIDEVDDRNNGHHENMMDNSCQLNDNKLNGSHDKSIIQVEYNTTNYNNCSNGTIDTQMNQEKSTNKANDSRRQVQRGNDSLKRARSVEALMRYDTLAWRRDVLEDSEDYPSSNPIILDEIIVSDYQSTVIKAKTADSITIEDKIQQARDRMNDPKPPRRLTSFMSETERPPPDLVKQTLLKFEASANKRTRTIQRYGNGDVAAKVATYKSKMSQDKSPTPTQITSKLPPSGFGAKKPLIKPRTTSPKPPAFLNGSTKEPTTLTKKIYTKTIEHDIDNNSHNFNGNGLKTSDVERMNQKNSAANYTRFDTSAYRNKIASPDSPPMTSPSSCDSPRPSYVYDMVRRRESNHADSPLITQLARKTESLVLATPKSRKTNNHTVADVAFGTDDSSVQPSDNDEVDDATSNSSETGWSESYDVNISDNEDSSEIDMDFLAKKPPMPKSKLNGSNNQIKATVISVQPTNCISNGSMDNKKSEQQPEPSVRQIGIIRPLNHEIPPIPTAKPPPVPIARKLPSSATTNSTPKKDSPDAIKVSVAAAPIVVSTQHSVVLPSSTSSVVVTNSVSVATSNDVQGDVVVIECSGDSNIDTKPMSPLSTPPTAGNNRTKLINNTEPNTISIDTRSIVHQKNLLNKEKSEEVLNGSSPQGLIQSPIKWNIKKSTVVSSSPVSNVAVNQTSPSPPNQQTAAAAAAAAAKQRPSDIQTTNTMVFNFSNRKDVPDYIENDGLVIRRKRELPKVRKPTKLNRHITQSEKKPF